MRSVETPSDTLAPILERDPDLHALPSSHRLASRMLKRCLDKDPKRRLHDIAEARIEIEDAMHALAIRTDDVVPVPAKSSGGHRVIAVADLESIIFF